MTNGGKNLTGKSSDKLQSVKPENYSGAFDNAILRDQLVSLIEAIHCMRETIEILIKEVEDKDRENSFLAKKKNNFMNFVLFFLLTINGIEFYHVLKINGIDLLKIFAN